MRLHKGSEYIGVSQSFKNNKALEVNAYWHSEYYSYFEVTFRWGRKCDHAGLEIGFCIGRFEFEFKLYDTRHWNHVKDRWYGPTELEQYDE